MFAATTIRDAVFAVLVMLVIVIAGVGAAQAERRVALVIGNSAYQATRPLPNPANDARTIAETLKAIGFDAVEVRLDQTFADLRETLRTFARTARDSDVALVFYAGHGMEVGGVNYIVPVDARLQSDQDVPYEALPLDWVLSAIEPARRLRLVILDACRDNPLAAQMAVTSGSTRSIGRGLARVEPAGDTLVAYAAKAGSVAEDGDGANSPFTRALVANLPTPGLDIRLMFGRVRDAVLETTGRRQEPFVYGSSAVASLARPRREHAAGRDGSAGDGCRQPGSGVLDERRKSGSARLPQLPERVPRTAASASSPRPALRNFENASGGSGRPGTAAVRRRIAGRLARPAAGNPVAWPAPAQQRTDRQCLLTTVLSGQQGNSYGPANVLDGRDRTAWVEGVRGDGSEGCASSPTAKRVDRVVIANGYAKSADIYGKTTASATTLEFSSGDIVEITLDDDSTPQASSISTGRSSRHGCASTFAGLSRLEIYRYRDQRGPRRPPARAFRQADSGPCRRPGRHFRANRKFVH
ncbi:MAG: caspase family protein [Hyphomicrobiales bacterium]